MNAREELFCREYLIDLNAVQAAIRAGYSRGTARDASRWIDPEHPRKPTLRARIDEALAERSRRTGVNADRVVRELARIAFSDLTDVADLSTGEPIDGAGRDDTAAIASVKVKRGEDFIEREVRSYDKLKALELLGKHLGMFAEQVQLQGAVPVIVDDTRDE